MITLTVSELIKERNKYRIETNKYFRAGNIISGWNFTTFYYNLRSLYLAEMIKLSLVVEIHDIPDDDFIFHILKQYKSVVASKGDKFKDLDKFVRSLHITVKSRKDPYITQDELSKLMEWKLNRGKFRPRLQNYIKALTDEEVMEASSTAFKESDIKTSLNLICKPLKGVGPATGSLILGLYRDIPFMSDEALSYIGIDKPKYTIREEIMLIESLRKISPLWSLQEIEQFIWIRSVT